MSDQAAAVITPGTTSVASIIGIVCGFLAAVLAMLVIITIVIRHRRNRALDRELELSWLAATSSKLEVSRQNTVAVPSRNFEKYQSADASDLLVQHFHDVFKNEKSDVSGLSTAVNSPPSASVRSPNGYTSSRSGENARRNLGIFDHFSPPSSPDVSNTPKSIHVSIQKSIDTFLSPPVDCNAPIFFSPQHFKQPPLSPPPSMSLPLPPPSRRLALVKPLNISHIRSRSLTLDADNFGPSSPSPFGVKMKHGRSPSRRAYNSFCNFTLTDDPLLAPAPIRQATYFHQHARTFSLETNPESMASCDTLSSSNSSYLEAQIHSVHPFGVVTPQSYTHRRMNSQSSDVSFHAPEEEASWPWRTPAMWISPSSNKRKAKPFGEDLV